MENCIYGAFIERGRITSAGAGKYDVESIDRSGVRAYGLKTVTGYCEPCQCKACDCKTLYGSGDNVYFFMFNDGHGMILGKIE